MFEPDARRPLADRPTTRRASGFDDEEPPESARAATRVWEDVPDEQWDDWRWQIAERHPLRPPAPRPAPLHRRRARSHRPPGRRVQARHPAVLLLPHRPRRPRTTRSGSSRCPRRWKRRTPRATSWTTRSKRTRTRPSRA